MMNTVQTGRLHYPKIHLLLRKDRHNKMTKSNLLQSWIGSRARWRDRLSGCWIIMASIDLVLIRIKLSAETEHYG